MISLFWAVLLASLSGSLHCVGMCGGFVTFYAGSDRSHGWSRSVSHIAYNGGRLLTYSMLGVAAGIMGRVLDLAGEAAGLQRGAAMVAGALMVAWGVIMLLQVRGVQIGAHVPAFAQRFVSAALGQLSEKPPVIKALALGLLSTFLPCGWLYAFAITAAGTGDPMLGALVMAAFWLGTLPWMLSLGLGIQALAGPLRRHLPAISALVLIVIGMLTVFDRAAISVERFREIQAAVTLDEGEAEPAKLNPWDLPCCQEGAAEDSTGSKP